MSHHARRSRGMTLAEILLAATLGSVLLLALASTTGVFAETIEHLDADSVDPIDAAAARIAADVRYAWSAEVPSRTELRLTDGNGELTRYFRNGSTLTVELPTGEQGTLFDGLSTLTFESKTLQRLREGNARTVSGRAHTVPQPATAASTVRLDPGNELALAFCRSSVAGASAVSGVADQVRAYSVTTVQLPLAGGSLVGTLRLDLYPARAIGDARPRPGAAALGSASVPIVALPVGVATGGGRFATPGSMISIAMGALSSSLQPGVGYSLVLRVSGLGSLGVVGSYASAAGAGSSVTYRASGAAAWADQSVVVPFQLSGDMSQTRTVEQPAVASVTTTLQAVGGRPRISSTAVYSQVMAPDAWSGVVPGEAPPSP